MDWCKPKLTEVNMSAEIGGYQSDPTDDDEPRFITPMHRVAMVERTPLNSMSRALLEA